MAKFCTKCGEKLVDGKCSNCDYKKSSTNYEDIKDKSFDLSKEVFDVVGGYTKRIFNLIKELFTKPVTTIKTYTKAENTSLSCILLLLASISMGLLILVAIKEIYGYLFGGINNYESIFTSYVQTIKIPYFKIFVVSNFIVISFYLLEAFILYFALDKILKIKFSFKKALNYVSLLSIPLMCASFLSILGVFISIYIVYALIIFALLFTFTYFVLGLNDVVRISEEKMAPLVIFVYSITTVVVYLMVYLFMK